MSVMKLCVHGYSFFSKEQKNEGLKLSTDKKELTDFGS
jgi:hypothetical protein